MNQQQQQQGRIMIDLETMSTAPNAAIVAVGAVRFGVSSGVGESFYRRVDLASSMAAGLIADADTIRWWMRQSDAARDEVATLPGGDLSEVLYELEAWIRRDDDPEIWGNGSASDAVWLESAFRGCGFDVPWRHWQVRCFRTVKALLPWVPSPKKPEVGHHALHDAVCQAHHAVAVLREMERMRPVAVLWPAVEPHETPCVACGDTGTAEDDEGRPTPCGCWFGRAGVAAADAIRRVPISPGGPPIMAAPLAAAGPHLSVDNTLRVVDNSPAAKAAEANKSAETAAGLNGESAALCAVAPGDSVLRTGVSSLPGDFFRRIGRRIGRDQED